MNDDCCGYFFFLSRLYLEVFLLCVSQCDEKFDCAVTSLLTFFFFSLQIKFKFTSGLLRRKRYHGRFVKSFFVLWRFKSTWIYLPLSHVMTMGNKLMLSYPVSDLSFLVTIQAQHWLKILLDNEFLFVLLRINTF